MFDAVIITLSNLFLFGIQPTLALEYEVYTRTGTTR